MAGSFLLDTSVVVDLFRKDTAVEQRTRDAAVIYLASIALGELYYGARKSRQYGARKSRQVAQGVIYVDQFATRNIVLDCDIETARRFGIIKR